MLDSPTLPFCFWNIPDDFHLTLVLLNNLPPKSLTHGVPPSSIADVPGPPGQQLEAPGALCPLPFPKRELIRGAGIHH